MSSILIRKGQVEDIDRVMEIVGLSMTILQSAGNFQWTESYPARHHFEKDVVDGTLYVAVDKSQDDDIGVVVGMISHTDDPVPEYAMAGCDVQEKCIIPHRLAVHPDCRGKGVAQKLMLYGDQVAREKGYKYCRVDTMKDNAMMRSVFEKIGYTFVGDMTLASHPPTMMFVVYEKLVA